MLGLASAHHWRIDHFTVNIGAFTPGVVANKIIPITNKGKIIEIIIFIKGNRVWLSASREAKGLNPVSIEIRYITPTIIPTTSKNIGDKKNHRPSFLHMLFMTKNKIQYIIVNKKCFLSKKSSHPGANFCDLAFVVALVNFSTRERKSS